MSASFERLFNPRGIAIVGAQPDPTRGGGQPLRALQAYGYAGNIYPVHPSHREVSGLRCYRSVMEIDAACDVAVIATPAGAAVEAIRECGRKGIAYAVVYSGNFRVPSADGRTLADDLKAACREAGVRMIGPNCLGVVNLAENVYASFGSMSREPRLRSGCVSLVSQSGGFGYSMVLRCFAGGAGFRYLVSTGNELDITTPEIIEAYLDDPGTKVILAYIEGVADGRALMAVGRKALKAGKPILLWKAGNSSEGQRAAASHTGNMTGVYDIYRAALAQCGIIEVSSFEEVADLIKALSAVPLRGGRRVALVSASGGGAAVFADRAPQYGLSMPPLAPDTLKALAAVELDIGDSTNPMDCAPGFLNDANAPAFVAAADLILGDPGIDIMCVLLMTILGRQALNGARALAAAAARHGKPVMVFTAIPRDAAAESYAVLEQAGIPVLSSLPNLARVAAALADFEERRSSASDPAESGPGVTFTLPDDLGSGAQSEAASKAIVGRCGMAVSRDVLLSVHGDVGALVLAAPPYVVKVISPDIPHKTEVGGVKIGLKDAAAVRAAVQEVLQAAQRAKPDARIEGVMISEMVTDGVEALIGVVNDPVFGPVVAFGLGGVFAEVLKDVTYRVAPFGRPEARAMLSELRARDVFAGVRGGPALDADAVVEALVALSHFAWQFRDRIAEIDINPVMVRPRGKGAIAVDALVVMRQDSARA